MDKIVEAAKAAGGTTYTNRHYPGETACAFGPEALRAFYAIAYRAGLEDAAKVCEAQKEKTLSAQRQDQGDDPINLNLRMVAHLGCETCAEAIRKLGENNV